MTETTAQPSWVSNFNQFGPASGGAEFLVPLEAFELISAAKTAAGLEDFGDSPWRDDFEQLVWSLNNEAQLTALGRLMMRAELLRTLQVRLRLAEFWAAHPEVLQSEVKAPIIIAGAARTGTTILQEALSEDTAFHLPYTWKCLDPLPLGENREEDIERRIAKAKCEAEFWMDVQPEIRAQHDFGAELPTECITFMATNYCADYWGMVASMPTWESRRMEKSYFVDVYRWHKRLLQTMQYGEPQEKVWLLKSPAHLAFLEVMLDVYPDARFIHTHRDPVKCIPSTASIATTVRGERSDSVDYLGVGGLIAMGFQFAMEQTIDLRISGRLPESQIVDIHLRELVRDPVAAIGRIYAHFDLNFTADVSDKIVNYLANKPKGKFGKHEYDMSKFGMSPESLRENFKRYTDYYQLELED